LVARALWGGRLLLAVALGFGAEILLWADPLTRTPLDWGMIAVGYLALGTLALDLMIRFRVRDIYGLLMVALILTALNGLILNADKTLIVLPDHLITRVIGAYGLLTLEMIGLFLLLTAGRNRLYLRRGLLAAFVIGFFGAVWAKDAHTLLNWTTSTPDFLTVAAACAIGLGLIVLIAWGLSQLTVEIDPMHFVLSPLSFTLLVGVLMSLLFIRALGGVYAGPEVLATLGVVAIGWFTLYGERGEKPRTLMDAHLPPRLPSGIGLLGLLVVFFIGLGAGWFVPDFNINGFGPVNVLELAFVGIGFTWVPLVLVTLASRSLDRQWRQIDDI
jgi:hypothetical protein